MDGHIHECLPLEHCGLDWKPKEGRLIFVFIVLFDLKYVNWLEVGGKFAVR